MSYFQSLSVNTFKNAKFKNKVVIFRVLISEVPILLIFLNLKILLHNDIKMKYTALLRKNHLFSEVFISEHNRVTTMSYS